MCVKWLLDPRSETLTANKIAAGNRRCAFSFMMVILDLVPFGFAQAWPAFPAPVP